MLRVNEDHFNAMARRAQRRLSWLKRSLFRQGKAYRRIHLN